MFFDSPTYRENNCLRHMPHGVIVQKVAMRPLESLYCQLSYFYHGLDKNFLCRKSKCGQWLNFTVSHFTIVSVKLSRKKVQCGHGLSQYAVWNIS